MGCVSGFPAGSPDSCNYFSLIKKSTCSRPPPSGRQVPLSSCSSDCDLLNTAPLPALTFFTAPCHNTERARIMWTQTLVGPSIRQPFTRQRRLNQMDRPCFLSSAIPRGFLQPIWSPLRKASFTPDASVLKDPLPLKWLFWVLLETTTLR